MKIRTKLLIIIVCLSLTIIFNLMVIGNLVNRVGKSIQTTQEVNIPLRATSLRLLSHLRDAEAALYGHQIGGTSDFVRQFQTSSDDFLSELSNLENLSSSEQEKEWINELRNNQQSAGILADEYVKLRDIQVKALEESKQLFDKQLLAIDHLKVSKSIDAKSYQITLNTMQSNSTEMQRAVMGYIASGNPIDLVKFSTAEFSFKLGNERLYRLDLNEEELVLAEDIYADHIKVGSLSNVLIQGYVRQEQLFSNFSIRMRYMAQNIIADQLLPFANDGLSQAQNSLNTTIARVFFWSLILSSLALLVVLGFSIPLFQQVAQNFQQLLSGADRVAVGNLKQPIPIQPANLSKQDELGYLGRTMNEMMLELARREQRLQDLHYKQAVVQEEERRLVGLDLHDGLTQILLSANMHINTFKLLNEKVNFSSEKELHLAHDRLREAIEEVNWVISELRPTELEDFGLVGGLRYYTTKIAEQEGWQLDFKSTLTGQFAKLAIDPAVETAIFRICQESLSNAKKYALAKHIEVELSTEGNLDSNTSSDIISLVIQDDGCGFDLDTLEQQPLEHLGLTGMRERAELLGGELSIETAPNEGSRIIVKLPIKLQTRPLQTGPSQTEQQQETILGTQYGH